MTAYLKELLIDEWLPQEPGTAAQPTSAIRVPIVDQVDHIINDEAAGRAIFLTAWYSLTDERTHRGQGQVSSYYGQWTGNASWIRTA